MPEMKDIALETPSSSSGESEKLKEAGQRKKRKFLRTSSANLSSQIPRANSARTSENIKQPSSGNIKEPSKSVLPCQIRKSLSQMDLKQSKNAYNRLPRNAIHNIYNVALPKPVLMANPQRNHHASYLAKENLFYVVNEPEIGGINAKVAGMKIFATIMLNAWRKRRDDVRRLTDEVDQLQRKSIKVKNQIHVLNSVFRNEQKTNEKLSRQLRHTNENYQKMQSSVESLTTSLFSSKAEASLYEQQLHSKEQENDTLNNILSETKSQLFKSMTQIRHLQTSLSCEQRKIQELENQKNELLNELAAQDVKSKKEAQTYLLEVYRKDEDLSKANSEIKMLETLLLDLKHKEFEVQDLRKLEIQLKTDIETLKCEASSLKADLNKCFGARMKHLWQHFVHIHYNTLALIHLGALYLLPAIPPPESLSMPVRINLGKVMSIIKD